MTKSLLIILSLILLLSPFNYSLAQEEQEEQVTVPPQPETTYQETLKGTITEILEEGSEELYGTTFSYQRYNVLITEGTKAKESVEILNTVTDQNEGQSFEVGDSIYIFYTSDATGGENFYITDYVRTNFILIYLAVFLFFLLLIIKLRGINLIVSWMFSMAVILKFILPKILEQENSALIIVTGALMIAPVIYYLAHGFSRKTTIGLFSSLLSLFITIIFTYTFFTLANISGLATEEALFFQVARSGVINTKGLIIAGIIIGSLGIISQLTFLQIEAVEKLKEKKKKLNNTELFHQALENNRSSIVTTVNSLLFLYLGATLPFLVVFVNNPLTHAEVINSEMIAVEIIRVTAIGLGLLMAVPISTLLAIFYPKGERRKGFLDKVKQKLKIS